MIVMQNDVNRIINECVDEIASTGIRDLVRKELKRKLLPIVEDLKHFKDTHIGLWATDKEPEDKTDFFRIN